MESLGDVQWDVVISGTGLPQSLLALALSRSDKKILHIDRNDYYGGDEAALSLSEAEVWAAKHAGESRGPKSSFSHAVITKAAEDATSTAGKLGPARAYSLALAPQLLYSRSSLLPALVSSKTHNQLEFQAMGSWFVVSSTDSPDSARPQLTRVPGGREDVFQDGTLDLKAKRSLMKFLRFVTNYEEHMDTWREYANRPFSTFLEDKFSLPAPSHAPITALALSDRSDLENTVEYALPRIYRHLSSIGMFGPGFSAVLPKWGGLAEIGQVACRACAVGGGVYVLGRGITDVQPDDDFHLRVQLSDGELVTTSWLAGTQNDLPGVSASADNISIEHVTTNSISIVSSALMQLFPTTSEGGVTPAGAAILIEPSDSKQAPIHILAHSSESGECPSGQCVLYASTAAQGQEAFSRLDDAVASVLKSIDESPAPEVLWSLRYRQSQPDTKNTPQRTGPVVTLHAMPSELALEDSVLGDVKSAWEQITGEDAAGYMKFEMREGMALDEDDSL